MKTMTCSELGGTCDRRLSAETWQGIPALMMTYFPEKHPVVAANMEEMIADPREWMREVRKEWEATPEEKPRNN
jgi:hypothetical protein